MTRAQTPSGSPRESDRASGLAAGRLEFGALDLAALEIVGLVLLGMGVWASDLSWLEQWEDAAPAMLALPLAFWLGTPWTRSSRQKPLMSCATSRAVTWVSVIGAALYLLGAASQWMIWSAAGWTCLLAAWMMRIGAQSRPSVPWVRLLPLALLSFPWLIQWQALGWWFRLSGAAAAEMLLLALQWDVMRQGTELWLNDVCVTVGEACSGLKGLQAMLVGGSYIAIQTLSRPRRRVADEVRYWLHLPILLAAAWTANTARIVLTAVGTRWAPRSWLDGAAHQWQGWLLLCLAFLTCQWLFGQLRHWDWQR